MEPDQGFKPTLQLWTENVDYEAAIWAIAWPEYLNKSRVFGYFFTKMLTLGSNNQTFSACAV